MARVHDTMLMSYLCNPVRPDGHSLKAWGNTLDCRKGDMDWPSFLADPRTRQQKSRDPELVKYALQDIVVTKKIWDHLCPVLKRLSEENPKFRELYFQELKYMQFLIKCHANGYQLDMEALPLALETCGKRIDELTEHMNKTWPVYPMQTLGDEEKHPKQIIYSKGSFRQSSLDPLGNKVWTLQYNRCPMNYINWNSGAHKLALLEKVGWEPTKKTEKGADSIDAGSLEPYVEEDSERGRLCKAILDNQALVKIQGTYLSTFQEKATPAGVLRGNFNQCVTKTGRLSSSEPNLQNLARRGEYGSLVRSLFIAFPGYTFASADLDQIEFRIVAHFMAKEMKDFRLIKPFLDGVDVHEYNKNLWGLAERDDAKTIVYSILFGGGPMVCGKGNYRKGKKMLDAFHKANPKFDKWKENVVAAARKAGGVLYNEYGRRFVIPNLNSKDADLRSSAERSCISCKVQGTAGDLFKHLTNREYPTWDRLGLLYHGPVHDEITFSLPTPTANQMGEIIRKGLYSPPGELLLCEVASKIKLGKNWQEVH
jgi:DNA polymerase I-like protein with 3'-5' exonuclease and polymerase domains